MTPEELAAALAAIHRYLSEIEKPIEIREVPINWKLSARVMI
ncbi:MAG: hypothetical protein ABWW66_01495 [Archaeoglobaceae archaeon]